MKLRGLEHSGRDFWDGEEFILDFNMTVEMKERHAVAEPGKNKLISIW